MLTHNVITMATHNGHPQWLPTMAKPQWLSHNGYPQWLPTMAKPQWLPTMATHNGYPTMATHNGYPQWLPTIADCGSTRLSSPHYFGRRVTLTEYLIFSFLPAGSARTLMHLLHIRLRPSSTDWPPQSRPQPRRYRSMPPAAAAAACSGPSHGPKRSTEVGTCKWYLLLVTY